MECSSIPQINYGDFSRHLHNQAAKKRIPIGGGLEPTFRCNLKCVHCYSSIMAPKLNTEEELSFREICGILDQIAEEGCLWLLITGGEPLCRKDFLDIYTYAKKKGFIITLFTNGTLITKEIIKCFRQWRPFNIEITLYGATKETYESVTQIPGSFVHSLRGIDLLLENNLPLRLKSIIMTLNKHEIWEMKKVVESYGMPFLFDPILSPGLDGSRKPCSYRLPPLEIVELDLADQERLKSWQEYLEDFTMPPPTDHLYLCGAGETSFLINLYGKLQLCALSRFPNYDLRQGTFKQGWHYFFEKIRERKVKKDFKCRNCEIISLCGQCPGWSYLECGNWDTPIEYLCQIAHLRAKAFKIN